jgi:hypothetical protein
LRRGAVGRPRGKSVTPKIDLEVLGRDPGVMEIGPRGGIFLNRGIKFADVPLDRNVSRLRSAQNFVDQFGALRFRANFRLLRP